MGLSIELRCDGTKPSGQPCRAGIRHPEYADENTVAAWIEEGWRHVAGQGWFCPQCSAKKKKAMEEGR